MQGGPQKQLSLETIELLAENFHQWAMNQGSSCTSDNALLSAWIVKEGGKHLGCYLTFSRLVSVIAGKGYKINPLRNEEEFNHYKRGRNLLGASKPHKVILRSKLKNKKTAENNHPITYRFENFDAENFFLEAIQEIEKGIEQQAEESNSLFSTPHYLPALALVKESVDLSTQLSTRHISAEPVENLAEEQGKIPLIRVLPALS